ncbi:redoxin domain-containing protein [Candidatus Fermentibacterales bacterium]|nr:redoxin domain-containing protein [Candidatus Fermentibacterales bacterium]
MGEAIDFELRDHHNEVLALSGESKGRKVLLSFHPLAWTPVCRKQMMDLEASFEELESLGVLAVGISVDAWPSKHAWAREMGTRRLRLLSDFWPHGAVAGSLGLFRERDGISERANVLLDERLREVWRKVYPISEAPDLREVLEAIRGL